MRLLAWFIALVVGATVGPESVYSPRIDAPSPVVPVAPEVAVDPVELRRLIHQHARTLALVVSLCLLAAVAAMCALSSDACVKRRINRNRRLPLGVDDED